MRVILALIAVGLMASAGSVKAGDYMFDIPQLVGHYLGDIPAAPTFDLEVDLGMEFAQIDGASLQLSGTHIPGLAGDLNSSYTFPLTAEVVAWSARTAPAKDVIIDQMLSARSMAFEFDEPFRALGPPGSAIDFSPWCDGIAEFQFSVHPPLMPAIYYLIDMPSVTITSATLVIEGQPNLDAFMLQGDFDRNGTIDGMDLLAWQKRPSVGLLTDWQTSYGQNSLTAGIAVPEPRSVVILLFSSVVSLALIRQFC